nr:hypothetical protein [uncultured Campylobacter sp.]
MAVNLTPNLSKINSASAANLSQSHLLGTSNLSCSAKFDRSALRLNLRFTGR